MLSSFADGSVDVLLIDGLHTYSGVAGDLRAWWPKMHPHGLVIMNDMPNINFLDVTRAALDFFAWRPLPRLSLGSEGTPPGAGNAALILAEQDVAPPTTARLYHKKHSTMVPAFVCFRVVLCFPFCSRSVSRTCLPC